MELSRHKSSLLACIGLVATFAIAVSQLHPTPREANARSGSPLWITRESAQTFKVSSPGAPPLQLTFLTATTVRIHVPSDDVPPVRLPEYMIVKPVSSYSPVVVAVETRSDGATLATSGTTLDLSVEDGRYWLSLRTPDKTVIETWHIDPGARTMQIELRSGERIYGFGDKRAALDQRGQQIEMLNRDAYLSETNDSYKSIPFYMSSAGYGLFFHNFYPSMFDVGASRTDRLLLNGTGGDMDFFVFLGAYKDVLSQYTELTGRPAMLPRWAFGYHQAKASYDNDDAFTVARQMRRKKLPVDAIYYDDWVDEAVTRQFVTSLWNRHRVRLTMGFGMPLFGSFGGVDDSAFLNDLAARNYLLLDRRRRPAIGPDELVDNSGKNSAVAYLDYFSPHAVDHVFATKWEQALRNGVILGMVDFGEMDRVADADHKIWPSLGMSVAKTRNLYGLVYPLAVVNGVIERTGSRSTGMVRAGFAGTQRLGWATTGDSYPSYGNFRAHTRGMINLTLSGFSNVGQDIGGWDHKGPDALYARWFAAGTFHPFMWAHGQGDHEPYSHGVEVEKVAREFLNLRYRMVPYFYSLQELAHRTGMPVLRSLPLQEPADAAAARIDDAFFIGDNLLVAPLFNDEGDRKIYLPQGTWYDFFGELPRERGGREVERRSVPLDRIPVYVRAGAVIPLGPVMQFTGEKPVDPLSVNVYSFAAEELTGAPHSTEFSLYEDDGLSTAYQQGAFQRTHLRFRQTSDAIMFDVTPESGDGKFQSATRAYQLNFRGVPGKVSRVLVDGQPVPQATKKPAAGKASWSMDEGAGGFSVSIPRQAKRAFTVEATIADTKE